MSNNKIREDVQMKPNYPRRRDCGGADNIDQSRGRQARQQSGTPLRLSLGPTWSVHWPTRKRFQHNCFTTPSFLPWWCLASPTIFLLPRLHIHIYHHLVLTFSLYVQEVFFPENFILNMQNQGFFSLQMTCPAPPNVGTWIQLQRLVSRIGSSLNVFKASAYYCKI